MHDGDEAVPTISRSIPLPRYWVVVWGIGPVSAAGIPFYYTLDIAVWAQSLCYFAPSQPTQLFMTKDIAFQPCLSYSS